jgi:multidrug resistance efflux pump
VETGYELRLPTLTDVRVFGIQFSSWIVTITLGTFVAGILIGLIVASLVDIDQVVEAPGQLHPVDVQPIRPLAGGMIVDVLVETGDTVQAGQPLLQLDTADLENRRMQLRSQIASARIQLTQATYANRFTDEEQRLRSREAAARVEEARTNLRRQMVRHRRGADVSTFLQTYQPGSSIDLDQAVSGLDIAETKLALAEQAGRRARLDSLVAEQHREDVRRLQAEMAHVQRQISRAQVVAPSTGVVLNDQLETLVGRLIQRGDLVLEIASLDTWQAHLFVGQSDVHLVQVGDSSKVEVDAFIEANELVTGRVTSVGAVPVGQGTYPGTMQPSSTSPRSRAATYRVVVELDPNELETLDPQKFRRGFTVRGQVITTSSSILEHLWRWGREKLNV